MSTIKLERKKTELIIKTKARDIKEMRQRLNELGESENSLMHQIKNLSFRNVIIIPSIFFLAALVSSSYGIYVYPDQIYANPEAGFKFTFLQVSIILVILGIVFLVKSLLAIEVTARGTEVIEEREVPEKPSIAAYYFVNYPYDRLIVDWNMQIAYFMDERTDSWAKEGKIPTIAIPGIKYLEWARLQRLKVIRRGPKKEELDLI